MPAMSGQHRREQLRETSREARGLAALTAK